jgi:hypothetical protein
MLCAKDFLINDKKELINVIAQKLIQKGISTTFEDSFGTEPLGAACKGE